MRCLRKQVLEYLWEHYRRLTQVICALLYNANLGMFFTGGITRSPAKQMCVPGLNCYSCPAAIGSCPLGSLQAALGKITTAFPMYVVGLLLLFGVLLGRVICGFLCPFGLIQELIYKLPTKKIEKSKWTLTLSKLKYVVLAVLVIGFPLYTLYRDGVLTPTFCKWLCPAGTLEGGIPLLLTNEALREIIGWHFLLKSALLVGVLTGSVFLYRFFCRFLCPLGAFYGLFNRVSIFGVRVDEHKCIHCNNCINHCKLDVRRVADAECIRCGECKKNCPTNAITSLLKKRRNPNEKNPIYPVYHSDTADHSHGAG